MYNVGDIVFASEYDYADGSKGNNHLFVIIDYEKTGNNLAISIDYFGMLISSQIQKQKYKYNILIPKNKKNGLNKDSIVKTDVLYQLPNSHIMMKVGTVDPEEIETYIESFKKYLCEISEEKVEV